MADEISPLDRALDEMLKLKDWHNDVRLMIGQIDGKVPSPVGPRPVDFVVITAEVSRSLSVEDRHNLHLGIAAIFLALGRSDWSLAIVGYKGG